MDEKTIQDLLAKYPEDLIEPGLTLFNKEGYIGSAYYDLLYQRKYGDMLLVEVKAIPIKGRKAREVTGQILEYHSKLRENNSETPIWMMVIAPEISEETQKLFDKYEIDYKEISMRQFQRVANQHSYDLSHVNTNNDLDLDKETNINNENKVDYSQKEFSVKKKSDHVKLYAYRLKGNKISRPIQVTQIISKQEICEYVKHVTKKDIDIDKITNEVVYQFSARKKELIQGRLKGIPDYIKNEDTHIKELHDWIIKQSKNDVSEDAINCMMQCFGKFDGFRYKIEVL
jgi:hypothetical protein